MHHLLPPEGMIGVLHGCELLFPDTAFFNEGQKSNAGLVKSIIKTEANGCLTMINQPYRINHHAVRTSFSLLVRDRWNEVIKEPVSIITKRKKSQLKSQQKFQRVQQIRLQNSAGSRKSEKSQFQDSKADKSKGKNNRKSISSEKSQSSIKIQTRSFESSKNKVKESSTDKTSQETMDVKKKEEGKDATRWRDQVIMRFKEGFGLDGPTESVYPLIKAMNEIEFINAMDRRANDPFWKRIDSIQTGIKIERGPDRHFMVKYRHKKIFHVDDLSDLFTFDYDYKIFDQAYYDEIVEEIKETH